MERKPRERDVLHRTLDRALGSGPVSVGASPRAFRRCSGHSGVLPAASGVHWPPSFGETMIQPKIVPFDAKRVARKRPVGESPGIDRTWAWLNAENVARGMDGPEVGADAIRHNLLFTVPEGFPALRGARRS